MKCSWHFEIVWDLTTYKGNMNENDIDISDMI